MFDFLQNIVLLRHRSGSDLFHSHFRAEVKFLYVCQIICVLGNVKIISARLSCSKVPHGDYMRGKEGRKRLGHQRFCPRDRWTNKVEENVKSPMDAMLYHFCIFFIIVKKTSTNIFGPLQKRAMP